MLQQFLSIPEAAIFALVNHSDKRVYISYSARLHQRLGAIATSMFQGLWKFPQMSKDWYKLELTILETRIDKCFVKYFIDDYRNKGYDIYNGTDKVPLGYKFRIDLDLTSSQSSVSRALVVAVNKRNEREILGKFRTMTEAKKFLKYVSKNNPCNNLVYAI
jgi:hypothetical protein